MPTVTFQRENKVVTVEEGENLRYVALENGISVYCHIYNLTNCHGNGLCGSDKVQVTPSNVISPRTSLENFHLKKRADLRLSCQVTIHGDCTVVTQCGKK